MPETAAEAPETEHSKFPGDNVISTHVPTVITVAFEEIQDDINLDGQLSLLKLPNDVYDFVHLHLYQFVYFRYKLLYMYIYLKSIEHIKNIMKC